MAIDCVNKFKDEDTVVRLLQADTPYTGTIANQFDGAFFKFEMIENETIFFTLRLNPNTSQAINVQFTLYRKDGETFTNLGTSVNDEFYNTFEYDATPAEYYVCITTDWSISYELTAEFTDYPFVLIADCAAYHGAYTPPTEFARRATACDSPIFYQIIEGTLPAGLEFSSEGIIHGTPQEQDCEPAAADMPPSFTWWEEDEGKERTSYGVEHRIVIRAALLDSPGTFVDREFSVCVHNNWDFDRDHFLSLKPNWERQVFVKPEDAPKLDLNPEPEEEPLELVSECPPCEKPAPQQATLQELKELAKMVVINDEYAGLVKINDDGLCEVCEEPDDDTDEPIVLEQIQLEHCEPCAEPIVIEGLKPLPESLCNVNVEQIPVESEPLYVPGIPELCYPELLESMMNTKVCGGRSSCPSSPIYPPAIDPKEKKALESQCPPCEET